MTDAWLPEDTSTHQDHVIAHVIGATVLGYFIHDETLHVLLDMGFIWKIYVDGEMGLLPHPVAIDELEVDEEMRAQIKADIDLLLRDDPTARLTHLTRPPMNCLIEEVAFFINDDRRRLVLTGEENRLAVETSLSSGKIEIGAI